MPEVAVRGHLVADGPLQGCGLREALRRAVPDRLAVDPDDEHATVPGHQCHFGEVRLERAEQFLGHPDGTGEPVALGAVLDAQPGLGRSAACGHGAKLAARPRDRPAGDRVGSDVLRCGGSGSGLLSPTFAQLSLQQHW